MIGEQISGRDLKDVPLLVASRAGACTNRRLVGLQLRDWNHDGRSAFQHCESRRAPGLAWLAFHASLADYDRRDSTSYHPVSLLFAAAYFIILSRFFDPSGFSKFSTLEGLASLQGSSWLLVAGWLHYLAFDLFVGTWEVRTARDDGIPHLAIVPSLFLTFMAGPAGLLLFIITRYLFRRRLAVEPA